MGLLDDIKDNLGFDNEQEKAQKAQDKAKEAADEAKKAQADADKAAGKTTAEPASNPTSAPASKPTSAPAAGRTHTVKSGDTLSEIGAKYGVSWKKIAEVNNIENPDLIFPGQVFKIPS